MKFLLNSASLLTLRKKKIAYSNILKILPPKNEKFQILKNSDILHVSAQNIDCGYPLEPPRRGGSSEYSQSIFWAEIGKNVYPCKSQFYYLKVGFKGVKIICNVGMFSWWLEWPIINIHVIWSESTQFAFIKLRLKYFIGQYWNYTEVPEQMVKTQIKRLRNSLIKVYILCYLVSNLHSHITNV